MFQEVRYNMNNELHRNHFRKKKQDFTSEILNVIKTDKPITKSCNAIPPKASRIFSHHKKQSRNNADNCIACFTITTSKAGTKKSNVSKTGNM